MRKYLFPVIHSSSIFIRDLKISSYEDDAILTKVEAWADSVAALN